MVLGSRYKTERDNVALGLLERALKIVEAHEEQTKKNKRSRWALEVLLANVEMEVADQLFISGSHRIHMAEALGVPLPIPQRVALAQLRQFDQSTHVLSRT